jgi:hypothetical protein
MTDGGGPTLGGGSGAADELPVLRYADDILAAVRNNPVTVAG